MLPNSKTPYCSFDKGFVGTVEIMSLLQIVYRVCAISDTVEQKEQLVLIAVALVYME